MHPGKSMVHSLLFVLFIYTCASEAQKLNPVNVLQIVRRFCHAAVAMFTLRIKISLHDMAVQI